MNLCICRLLLRNIFFFLRTITKARQTMELFPLINTMSYTSVSLKNKATQNKQTMGAATQ